MNGAKASIARRKVWESDPQLGLEGCHDDVDRENVLDLLVVIEDERRFHAAAALLTEEPVECERYRALVREDAALLANIRHGLASAARRRLSHRERIRQLEGYMRRLLVRSQQSRGHALLSTGNIQGG